MFLFLLYSFIGWAGESLSKTVTRGHLINSGFLSGPVCPIYGFGGFIMMFLCALFIKLFPGISSSATPESFILLFFVSFAVLSVWEYAVGVLLEKTLHTKYWDYSKNPFNLKGRVCLKNSIYWGLAGLAFVKIFEPWQEKVLLPAVSSVPSIVLIIFDIAAYSLFAYDIAKNIHSAAGLYNALNKIKELSDIIKMHTEELEFHTTEAAKEFAGDKIHSLKIRETQLRLRLSTYAYRIRTAFPDVKSEMLNKIVLPDYDKHALKERLSELRRKRNKNKDLKEKR